MQNPSSTPSDPGADKLKIIKEELRELGLQLFVLGSPWPTWKISGSFIRELDDIPEDDSDDPDKPSVVFTENDAVGDRILRLVPQHLREAFLSQAGQKIVSIL